MEFQQAKSGQNLAAFCWERGLSRIFTRGRHGLSQAAANSFVEVKVATTRQPAASAAIEIRLPGDRSRMVASGFDAHHLQALVAALEGQA